ncbi:SDR family oxidoreductase [Listeria innocua]|nr:SDR family NAD(P)-dependent oxidoreductase [Listeria innocua]EIU0522464.1 SDR family oxidoreductase [Listeria innocua]EJG4805232.1 SDR family oxidoreductase [Listeria innocua]EJG4852504.1 SDR family oxidoreductase [Listeria innocua]
MKKYVVITGASSGIGYATAKQFAKRKKNLILIARRVANLVKLKNEIEKEVPEVEVLIKAIDLTKIDRLEKLFSELDLYFIETWVNNAGLGYYSEVKNQNLTKTLQLLHLNIEALTVLSVLYVRKYHDQSGTQLINVSSAGGYTMVPTATTYCASKFYVSSFTEALSLELRESGSTLQAKVLAPAATKTEFGQKANDVSEYDYDKKFNNYHTSDEMAQFLLDLYDSDKIVGMIDRKAFSFTLTENLFSYANQASSNQK